MLEYLERVGHTPEELDNLNVIHVTGTKGKGSTCAFCDSILRAAMPGKKIGLYTSPHIVAVRERIRINGSPISEEQFAKYFFEVWDMLEKNDKRSLPATPSKPMYFRFVTLVAFHTFLSLKVDATILEVGVGGLYDSTNVVPRPVATGVSALGLDHVNVLGKTIKEIAFNKGGIFKKGVPAFSVEQPEDGMTMLKQRAVECQSSSLTVVPTLSELSAVQLGLAGNHQRQNASLAVYLAHTLLQRIYSTHFQSDSSPIPLSNSFIKGLQDTRWPGRCQEIQDTNSPGMTWFLDGAHTVESLVCGMEWFTSTGVGVKPDAAREMTTRLLIFNCTSGRSGGEFLAAMLDTVDVQLRHHTIGGSSKDFFDHVVFCTNVTYVDGGSKPDFVSLNISEDSVANLTIQKGLAAAWLSLIPEFPPSHVHVLPSVQHAIEIARSLHGQRKSLDVLVCGSLHLVGGVIEVADLAEVALRS
ncbi:tetrahydrofolylpolyglutamate synthase [Gautieria morchelliformis]|nr:tetrahydrofolylpolyglutamate synthase [Gautieria morchelliformis]